MSAVLSRRGLLGLGWLGGGPRVEPEGCLARTGCAVCVERCPVPGAIVVGLPAPTIDAAACDRCGRCVAVCPAPTACIVLG